MAYPTESQMFGRQKTARRRRVCLERTLEGARSPTGLRRRFRSRHHQLHQPLGRKDLILVFEAKSESKEDLALGVHPAVHALLDAVNRPKCYLGFPGKLCLSHQPILSQLADAILAEHPLIILFHAYDPTIDRSESLLARACQLECHFDRTRDFFSSHGPWTSCRGSGCRVCTSVGVTGRCVGRTHAHVASANPTLGSASGKKPSRSVQTRGRGYNSLLIFR